MKQWKIDPLQELASIDDELSDIHCRLTGISMFANDEQKKILETAFLQIFDLKGDTLTELRKLFKK